MQYSLVEYQHFKGTVNVVKYDVDPAFFELMMKFPAQISGGSAYNTFSYQLAEEMVQGAKAFAFAGKGGVISGFGEDVARVVEVMVKVAGNEGMMDESEVAQMRQVLSDKGIGSTQSPDAQPQQPAALSDEQRNHIRRLGGIE